MSIDITYLMEQSLENLGSCMITDAEGRYVFASNQRLRNTGSTKEEILGQYVHDIYPDSLVDQVIATKIPVAMKPMKGFTPEGPKDAFVSYYPLMRGNECVGCFIYTKYLGMESLFDVTRLISDLQKELEGTKKLLHNRPKPTSEASIEDIAGSSNAIKNLKREIEIAAKTSSNILITGERGTGKSLVARAIHNLSSRKDLPFVRVNCAIIPENQMQEELFGQETASASRAERIIDEGKFEKAQGGTLFIDDIHTLPLYIHADVTRAIQDNEIERIGGVSPVNVNPRIISATNTGLMNMVEKGSFSESLYYGLSVVNISIPPLREHKEDIPELADNFLHTLNVRLGLEIDRIHPRVYDILYSYDWPGNVRELQNAIERAMNYAYEGQLLPKHFKFMLSKQGINYSTSAETSKSSDKISERDAIAEALKICGGNKKAAAQMLGIARSTLYEKIRKYNL